MPTSTVEDYVKQVFLLQREFPGSAVPMGRLSGAMGITPGTTTTMVKAMAGDGLVTYRPRLGVRLTRKGEDLALDVLRRHRIAEAFLVEVMGMDWAEVHEDAERLEHAISSRVLDRMDAMLNRPSRDPHGDPIPASNGPWREPASRSLAGVEAGQTVEVSRILDQSPEFLNFIRKVGLSPGVRIEVRDRNRQADSVLIRTGAGQAQALSMRVAGKIAVASPGKKHRGGSP